MGTCAVSRYKYDRSQKTVTMQEFYYGHWSGIGIHIYKGHDIESRRCKNCDELINYTVRVSVVVPVSELQMLVKAQSFLRSVAVQVEELLILILSGFTDCLVFWICLGTQIML